MCLQIWHKVETPRTQSLWGGMRGGLKHVISIIPGTRIRLLITARFGVSEESTVAVISLPLSPSDSNPSASHHLKVLTPLHNEPVRAKKKWGPHHPVLVRTFGHSALSLEAGVSKWGRHGEEPGAS